VGITETGGRGLMSRQKGFQPLDAFALCGQRVPRVPVIDSNFRNSNLGSDLFLRIAFLLMLAVSVPQ
jgi:hypothetical protein